VADDVVLDFELRHRVKEMQRFLLGRRFQDWKRTTHQFTSNKSFNLVAHDFLLVDPHAYN